MITTTFKLPDWVSKIRFGFSAEAIDWLGQSTPTESGKVISHLEFFWRLLARMRFDFGADASFHSAAAIGERQAQISVKQLAAELGSGRKQLTNLMARMESAGLIRVDSGGKRTIVTFVCVEGIQDSDCM